MTARSRRRKHRLTVQATELAFAVPQVIAHRVARMASAGATPDARDRREFERMGHEKVAAFTEAWFAMALQGVRMQQDMTLPFLRAWNPFLPAGQSARQLAEAFHAGACAVLAEGVAPVHRVAVANAKRLRRRVR